MKKSTTKMSLVASIAALVLCCAMLIGTTFAWFTDTASTAVNSIQAGKLDIALEMKVNDGWEDAEGKMLSWVKAEGGENEAVLWEPGCTYRLPELRIVNKGNLALKYKIRISGIVGDAELLEVISFTYGGGINIDAEVSLAPHQATDGFIIEGHMSESAGNEYQDLSIEGIAITVVATQNTFEHDSNDNQYDAGALYPVVPTIVSASASGIVTDSTSETTISDPVSGVEATIPANTLSNGDEVELTIERTAVAADSVTYEIELTVNDAVPGTALLNPVIVKLNIGTDLKNVAVTHNGNPMTKVDNAVNDQEYSYNSATGVLAIATASFSPFTIAYEADYAASIGNVGYVTLQEAIDAAVDGDTVNLLKNVTLNDTLGIDKDIVLNLGQYVITSPNVGADKEEAIQISGDGVNPTNVTVKATTGGINVAGTNGACFLLLNVNDKPINFTLDGGCYYSKDYEFIDAFGLGVIIDDNGDVINWSTPSAGMTINVKDVSYSGDRGIHSINKNVTINVTDSSFDVTGYSAFYIGGGTVCTLENVDVNCEDRGVLAKSSNVYPDGDLGGKVYIKSGHYASKQTTPSWLLQCDEGCILSVTGGTFNSDPSAFVAADYTAVQNADNTWTVIPIPAE